MNFKLYLIQHHIHADRSSVGHPIAAFLKAFDRLALFHECAEGLMDVLAHSPIRQSKYWQIYALFQQLLKAHMLEIVCMLIDAL